MMMTDEIKFTLTSVPNQKQFKLVGQVCLIFAFVIAAVAMTLYNTDAITAMMFNIMMVIATLSLLESVLAPKLLRRYAKPRKTVFYGEYFRYYTLQEQSFTFPYSCVTGIRSDAISRTDHYNNIPVSDIYLKINTDKLPDFPNLYVKKGELKIPAVPDSEDPVKKIRILIPALGADHVF